jgi:hypothetical protein
MWQKWKDHTKGKGIVTTSIPQTKSIVQQKYNRKKASQVKKSVWRKKRKILILMVTTFKKW